MPKFARLALVVPTLAIMTLASATVALAATGVTVSIAPTAELTAKVEVVTTVTVSCPSGGFSMGSQVTIEEAAGNSIAHGSSFIPGIQCTGGNQVIAVTILADPSGPPFKNGSAIVSATLSACSFITCSSATATTTVKIH